MTRTQTPHDGRYGRKPTGPWRALVLLAYFSSLAFLSVSGMALGEDPDAGPPDEAEGGSAADGKGHPPPPARPAPPTDKQIPPAALSELEDCVLALINADRQEAGMVALFARGDLSETADGHSSQMASSGQVYHRSNLRQGTPSNAELVGENVGAGYDCSEVHNGFMASAVHAGNVMRPDFNFVGLGAVHGADGMFFITQVFMRAPLPMRLDPVEVTFPESQGAAPAPAAAIEEPAPAPAEATAAPMPEAAPAPPGSKVTGKTAAYRTQLES